MKGEGKGEGKGKGEGERGIERRSKGNGRKRADNCLEMVGIRHPWPILAEPRRLPPHDPSAPRPFDPTTLRPDHPSTRPPFDPVTLARECWDKGRALSQGVTVTVTVNGKR